MSTAAPVYQAWLLLRYQDHDSNFTMWPHRIKTFLNQDFFYFKTFSRLILSFDHAPSSHWDTAIALQPLDLIARLHRIDTRRLIFKLTYDYQPCMSSIHLDWHMPYYVTTLPYSSTSCHLLLHDLYFVFNSTRIISIFFSEETYDMEIIS